MEMVIRTAAAHLAMRAQKKKAVGAGASDGLSTAGNTPFQKGGEAVSGGTHRPAPMALML